jgi:hypothetical protein
MLLRSRNPFIWGHLYKIRKIIFFGQTHLFTIIFCILELSVKYSKESTKTLYLLKIGNKVVEVG